ncbi:hypothetical protein, partial [Burkholderia sp. Ac-20353]|uniref:hypothetical protein n=1 Tax=Burkholderia sp. Ac-20353 TaxID=2703894 RepID=UPI00197CAB1F
AAAELIGYNGGLARVRLVLEPWLAILRQRIDSYHYHDATVIDTTNHPLRHDANQSPSDDQSRSLPNE